MDHKKKETSLRATRSNPEKEMDRRVAKAPRDDVKPSESGGPKGPEPTRYGDWEIAGKCVDF